MFDKMTCLMEPCLKRFFTMYGEMLGLISLFLPAHFISPSFSTSIKQQQAACSLWFPPDDAAPGGYVCPREAALAFHSNSKGECYDECVEAGWGWGYVSCLEQVKIWTYMASASLVRT